MCVCTLFTVLYVEVGLMCCSDTLTAIGDFFSGGTESLLFSVRASQDS